MLLQPAGEADLAFLHALWNEPQVRRYLFDDGPVTQDVARDVLHDALARARDGLGLWRVERRDGGRALGCVGINPVTTAALFEPSLAGLLEPLAALRPEHWGRGYATEALTAVVTYAFRDLRVPELAAVNDAPNVASARMLLRLGFQPHTKVAGPKHPLHTYRLRADAFESRVDVVRGPLE